MMRRPDWEKRMVEIIDSHDYPFSYGKNDCCLFALDMVHAITGLHINHDYSWGNAHDANAILERTGGVIDIVDEFLMRIDRPVRGDIVAVDENGMQCLGVCMGNVYAIVTDVGIAYRPLQMDMISWSTV